MTTSLGVTVSEESTLAITCSFLDEDGAPVIPKSIVWTLTDIRGQVINNRQQVVVSNLAASVTIVLSGEDLALSDIEERQESVERVFTVEAVYDSTIGMNLPLKDACAFEISNLIAVV
jgi:hypothetical protein